MNASRRGIALPAALAMVITLAALASLASIAARTALREAAAVADEVRDDAARTALRARLTVRLAHTARAQLLAAPHLIGRRDTALTVTALVGPWHRLDVSANGASILAEFARASVPRLPWCAAAVAGGAVAVAPGALSAASLWTCSDTLMSAAGPAIVEFEDSLAASLVLPARAESLFVTSSVPGPAVLRAVRLVEIAGGAAVTGLVIAPIVRVVSGSTVRGMAVARESLQVGSGATVIGDQAVVDSAMSLLARLRRLGRGGLLLPP